MLRHLQPSSGRFVASLDGLRAVAILLVVMFHTFYANPASRLGPYLLGFSHAGHLGVQIFFVLSGYLIGNSIFRRPDAFDPADYARRRFAKIYPPFFLSLLLVMPFTIFWRGHSLGESVWSAVAYVLTIPNFHRIDVYTNPVYWSLLCEVHFYIALPLSFFFLRRFVRKPDIILTVLFLVVPTVLRLATWPPGTADELDSFLQLSTFPKTFDCFGYGMAFACIATRWSSSERAGMMASFLAYAGAVLLVLMLFTYAILDRTIGLFRDYTVWKFELFRGTACLSTFLLLFVTLAAPQHLLNRILSRGSLVLIGTVSYEWFLLHMPPTQFIHAYFGSAHGSISVYVTKTFLPALLTLALAIIFYRFYSFPILRWFNPQQQSAASTPSTIPLGPNCSPPKPARKAN
jgi:peptidoglycan/LPS O-acetylase OafA/YrhL